MKRSPKRSSVSWIRRMSARSEPRPMIMLPSPPAGEGGAKRRMRGRTPSRIGLRNPSPPRSARTLSRKGRGLAPSLVHQRAHLPDRGLEADEDGLADQEVADVELNHLGDGGDGADGLVVDAVAGVDLEPLGLGR